MNPNKELWEKGDFTKIASTMRDSGEALVASLGVHSSMHVLDLGCGDGTTALPIARYGAKVHGVDIASNLVAAGTVRAAKEGLDNLIFQVGDACSLTELEHDTYDLTISIFGAMFAPRPNDVAREMVRVTRPGGRIIMGNWIPGDPTMVAQILRISAAYTPPPPEGFVSPMLWGVESNIAERFGSAGIPAENIRCERDTYTFRYEQTPASFVNLFKTYYGPTMNAFAAADMIGKADDLQRDLEELFVSQNTSLDPDKTVIPATFLKVTVSVT